MILKYQKGFISVVIIALVAFGIGVVAAEGYVAYRNKQQEGMKNPQELQHQQIADRTPLNVATTSPETPQQTSQLAIPETQKNNSSKIVTTHTNTKLNCNNDWQCLISAASKCNPISGIVSNENVSTPPFSGFAWAQKTKYEIKKTGNKCTLIFSMVDISISLSAEERSKALAGGVTDAQIDTALKKMNDASKSTIGTKTTCTADNDTIVAYLSDKKNGNSGEAFGSSINMASPSSESTITTSSGQKITCSTPTTVKMIPN